MDPAPAANRAAFIKTLYLYLVSFVALMMVALALADTINIGLRTYIFTKADKNFYSYPEMPCPVPPPIYPNGTAATSVIKINNEFPCVVNRAERAKQDGENRTAERQRNLVRDLSFILVGLPLFLFHWRLARKKEVA